MLCLKPYTNKKISLKNRLVMPPMCMYQAENGFVNDFHLVHYGSRAVGGVGMIIVEATAVSPEGRITDEDLGIWDDQFIPGLKHLTDEIHRYGAKAVIQLAHAGRKSMSFASPHIAPSSIPFSDQYAVPVEMSEDEILGLRESFANGARRAFEAGFDGVEIHGAHGYLIHEFLSPLSNQRSDNYGGNPENRARMMREVITDVRKALDPSVWLQIRISASDYDPQGLKPTDLIDALFPVKELLDFIHVSSGGNAMRKIDLKPGYQVPFASDIKHALHVPAITVGLITEEEMIESILVNEEADLVALGRELLRNPYYVNELYARLGMLDDLPESYLRAYK